MRDPYSVLGVKRDAGADEIKAAWRTAAKAAHPDQNRDDPDATKRFAELGRAYDVLKDPAKRSRYDMQATKTEARKREQTIQQQREAAREAAERAKAAKANAERVMADLAKAEAEKAKADKAAQAAMAAAQAAKGGEQAKPGAEKPAGPQAQAQAQAKPAGAKPSGAPPSADEVLSTIFGDTPETNAAAENLRRESEAKNVESDDSDAPASKPSGFDPIELISALLRKIRGTQPATEKAPDLFVEATVTIDDLLKGNWVTVALPEGRQIRFALEPGVGDGHLVRLKGQGLKIPGMQRGDVAVTLKVAKHGSFTVDGFDIHTILRINLEHAVLGYETKVEGPEGPVDITIPAWSGSDQSVRLEGLGLPDGTGGRGALVVELRVLLWEKPDDKVTDLMRVMREGLYL